MRQFTDSEMDDLAAGWQRYKSEYETEPTHIWPFEHGFRSGLDHAAEKLAALEAANQELTFAFRLAGETCRKLEAELTQLRAESDGLRKLERLAKDVADYIRDTSWSMGPIRKLVEYIDNQTKTNPRGQPGAGQTTGEQGQ